MISHKVFICHSSDDDRHVAKLREMLEALRLSDSTPDFTVWEDSQIQAGADWEQLVKNEIRSSSIAILLISNSFFAKRFIIREELPLIRESRAKILPILVHSTASHLVEKNGLNKIQFMAKGAPLPSRNSEPFWSHIIEEFVAALNSLPTGDYLDLVRDELRSRLHAHPKATLLCIQRNSTKKLADPLNDRLALRLPSSTERRVLSEDEINVADLSAVPVDIVLLDSIFSSPQLTRTHAILAMLFLQPSPPIKEAIGARQVGSGQTVVIDEPDDGEDVNSQPKIWAGADIEAVFRAMGFMVTTTQDTEIHRFCIISFREGLTKLTALSLARLFLSQRREHLRKRMEQTAEHATEWNDGKAILWLAMYVHDAEKLCKSVASRVDEPSIPNRAVLHEVAWAEVVAGVEEFLSQRPAQFDLIVGIARSGLCMAGLFAYRCDSTPLGMLVKRGSSVKKAFYVFEDGAAEPRLIDDFSLPTTLAGTVRSILIVDDVTTYGTTLRLAERYLRDSFGDEIDVQFYTHAADRKRVKDADDEAIASGAIQRGLGLESRLYCSLNFNNRETWLIFPWDHRAALAGQ